MIASTKHTAAPVASLSGQYVSIGKVAQLLGVGVSSLRLWEKQGLVKAYRTPGGAGQRRYLLSEVRAQVLGAEEETLNEERRVCIYVRVSSASQQREGSLDRQLNRMLENVSQREGVKREDILVFTDTASAFGARPGLNAMTDALLAGRLTKIYVEHMDRLSRVASLSRLLEHLARKSGTQIVALDRDETVDEMKNSMLELVEYVTVIANRSSARKGAERRTKHLDPNTLNFIRCELASGRSIQAAILKANAAGYRTIKGEPISYRVALRHVNKVVDKLLPVQATNTFAEFTSQHLKSKKGSKVQAGAIHAGYKQWCHQHRLEPLTSHKCGEWLKAHQVASAKQGVRWYLDVELLGYPSVFKGPSRNSIKKRRQP